MRRHSAVDGSHPVQPDPYVRIERPHAADAWPVRFHDRDDGTDAGLRAVELHPDHIVLRRRVAGIPMKLSLRVSAWQGVAVRLLDEEGEGVALVLAHADPSLEILLYSAPTPDDVVAEWRGWSALLGLPMLVTRLDGTIEAAYPMLGRLIVARTIPRRRRRGALKHRRPTIFMRRAATRPGKTNVVYRGESEISARD
ncbi:MAG: hypothetical protein K0R27_2013 [Xanthobacteraceae bacterium]|nr:hypothetical protein [Xanthobacteraceae bacterium]